MVRSRIDLLQAFCCKLVWPTGHIAKISQTYFTVAGKTYPAAITAPANGNFTFSGADRGRTEQVDLAISAPTLDSVGDGIPDSWRQKYFGNATSTNAQYCATCDPDADGMNNLQEYIAGTDPTNSASVFLFSKVQNISPGVVQLTWPSYSSRIYTVLRSVGLGTNKAAYSPIGSAIAATPSFKTIQLTNNPSQGPYFYRLQVNMSP